MCLNEFLLGALQSAGRRLACALGGGGTGQGQPQVKVPLPTPQLWLWAPRINHSLPRPPEGAEKLPRTSRALPFGIFFNINDFWVFPKRFFLGRASIPGEEGSLLQLTSLLLPRNPPGAQRLLHPHLPRSILQRELMAPSSSLSSLSKYTPSQPALAWSSELFAINGRGWGSFSEKKIVLANLESCCWARMGGLKGTAFSFSQAVLFLYFLCTLHNNAIELTKDLFLAPIKWHNTMSFKWRGEKKFKRKGNYAGFS